MEGIKRYFYIILGFVGILLSGITLLVVLIQIKFAASFTLTAFCVVSWLLFILAVFQVLAADHEEDGIETDGTSPDSSEADTDPEI
jgi:hypothetical protein